MEKRQLKQVIQWLRDRITETDSVIKESKLSHNYGKATQYEGKRDAYLECLQKLNVNPL